MLIKFKFTGNPHSSSSQNTSSVPIVSSITPLIFQETEGNLKKSVVCMLQVKKSDRNCAKKSEKPVKKAHQFVCVGGRLMSVHDRSLRYLMIIHLRAGWCVAGTTGIGRVDRTIR